MCASLLPEHRLVKCLGDCIILSEWYFWIELLNDDNIFGKLKRIIVSGSSMVGELFYIKYNLLCIQLISSRK